MKLTFVSHAGFIVETRGRKIFTDPWTRGKAFNEGWALYAPPAPVAYDTIDYLYVTHEHPDHFSFATLKGIPADQRARLTVLYQEHASKRLKKAFGDLGFKQVLELPLYRWTRLPDGIELYCGSVGSMDSFLAFREDDQTILNLNDCVLTPSQYRYVRRQIGPVDLLLTQFSFANWVGNDSDFNDEAGRKIRDIRAQLEIFKPRHTIPFASFVYFCNQENARQNAWANTPGSVEALQLPTLRFMYPGDTVDLAAPAFDSPRAAEKYQSDLAAITIDPTPPPKAFDDIVAAANKSLAEFSAYFPWFLRRLAQPITIRIHDLGRSLEVHPGSKMVREMNAAEPTRYVMCAQVAWYTFNFSWGANALLVSGMYLDHNLEARQSRYFSLQNLLSTRFINFGSMAEGRASLKFLWRKKWEVFYRFFG